MIFQYQAFRKSSYLVCSDCTCVFIFLCDAFVEAISVDGILLSHLPVSFKNIKLQFTLALEEINVLLFFPALRSSVP